MSIISLLSIIYFTGDNLPMPSNYLAIKILNQPPLEQVLGSAEFLQSMPPGPKSKQEPVVHKKHIKSKLKSPKLPKKVSNNSKQRPGHNSKQKEPNMHLQVSHISNKMSNRSDYFIMPETGGQSSPFSRLDIQCMRNRSNQTQNSQGAQSKKTNNNHVQIQQNQYQQPIINQQVDHNTVDSVRNRNIKNPLFRKIKRLSSEGSIDFNGDIVRKTSVHSDNIKNYDKQRSSRYSPIAQSNKQKDNKRKSSTNRTGSSIRSRKSSQNPQIKTDNKASIPKQEKRQRQISVAGGFRGVINVSTQLSQLKQQIQQDSENFNQYILTQQLIKERGQCLNMLGKICSSMNLRRQSYAVSLCYIDNFIDVNTQVKNIKTIVIASLMLGLKLEHSSVINASHQFQTTSSLQSVQNITLTKYLSTQTETRSHQKSSQSSKFNIIKSKLPNILTIILNHQEIFSQYNRVLCRQQVMDMQMQMMVKLNFNFRMKSYCYWVNTLTKVWDEFVCKQRPMIKGKLVFKVSRQFKNLSYLYQLIEVSYYFPYTYFYPKSILILSIMYLLVRIWSQYTAQRELDGFQHYLNHLRKSTNIIFIDRIGINQLFGEFLGMLGLDMGDIVNCCQYVSHYLCYGMLRVFAFDDNRCMGYQQFVATYHYNPQIYRLFKLKYSESMWS